jgi:Response regulator containing a CheY-like receiver domain and an HTH DNA-binding domain
MKILIVDDDKLVGISLKTIIESESGIEVAGIGLNGREAIRLYDQLKPDILLMDIRMDVMTGLEAGEAIIKNNPGARILFLTTFADDEYIISALKMGAKGYVLKQNFESIVPSLKAVYSGQTVFGEDIIAKIPSMIHKEGKADFSAYGITEKETAIVELIAKGMSNREIAGNLFLSEGTVRNSISVILEKLQLKGRTQLAIFYYKNKSH